MTTHVTSARTAVPGDPSWRQESWPAGFVRDILGKMLITLDRLVPPPGGIRQGAELPAEWFRYPPI